MSKTNLGRVSVCPKGTYSATTSYKRLDVVNYGSGSWMALQDCTGVEPADGAYWMKLVDLTKDGIVDALGYTPAEEEGVIELINTITVEEDSDNVAITVDSDGNSFKLLRCIISVQYGGSDSRSLFSGVYPHAIESNLPRVSCNNYMTYSKNTYSKFEVCQEAGAWRHYTYAPASYYSTSNIQGTPQSFGVTSIFIAKYPYIDYAWVGKNVGGGNMPVPAGTIIKLYGVRYKERS